MASVPLLYSSPHFRYSWLSAVLAGQLNDVGGQSFLIIAAPWNLALGGAVLTERAADPALADAEGLPYAVDTAPSARRAQ